MHTNKAIIILNLPKSCYYYNNFWDRKSLLSIRSPPGKRTWIQIQLESSLISRLSGSVEHELLRFHGAHAKVKCLEWGTDVIAQRRTLVKWLQPAVANREVT